MSKSTVTAAEVRSFYREDGKRFARLSEAAQATVREGARGKLHPEVVEDHNKRRRTRQYTVGASKAASEAREAQRQSLREAGLLNDGARGPLSKAAREFLGQSKG